MVISITLTPPDKFVIFSGYERQRMHRMDIFFAFLFKQCTYLFACLCIIFIQPQMVLRAIKDSDKNAFFVRAPCNRCQVMVFVLLSRFQYNSLAGCRIIDAQSHLMRCATGHRVLDYIRHGRCNIPLDYRVVFYHRLVHAVVGEIISFRRKEYTLIYTKLIPVNGCAAHYILVSFCRYSHTALILAPYPQIVIHGIGNFPAFVYCYVVCLLGHCCEYAPGKFMSCISAHQYIFIVDKPCIILIQPFYSRYRSHFFRIAALLYIGSGCPVRRKAHHRPYIVIILFGGLP